MKFSLKVLCFLFFLFLITMASADSVAAKDCGGATQCDCGDTVVSSITLDKDISQGASPTCLVVYSLTEPKLVLDCGGHKIIGSGTLFSTAIRSIQNAPTIKNCKIVNFETGMWIGANHTITDNIIDNNNTFNSMGIRVGGPIAIKFEGVKIKNNVLKNGNVGIYNNAPNDLGFATSNDISFNQIEKFTIGMVLGNMKNTLIKNNTIRDAQTGINMYGFASINILSNRIENTKRIVLSTGINLGLGYGSSTNVEDNHISKFGTGIAIDSASLTVQKNTIKDSWYVDDFGQQHGTGIDWRGSGIIKENYIVGSLGSSPFFNAGGIVVEGAIEVIDNIVCANTPNDIINASPLAQGFGGNNACGPVANWDEGNGGCTFKCGNISGLVTDGHQYSVDDPAHPNAAALHPLREVKVTLQVEHVNITDFTNTSGYYSLYAPYDPTGTIPPLDARLRVDLDDKPGLISIFDWQGDQNYSTYFRTNEFKINSTKIIKNINANQVAGLDPTGHNAFTIGRLDDLAYIYFHIKEAADFANKTLGLTLDHHLPVEVYAWGPGTGAFYCKNATFSTACDFNTLDSKIVIGPGDSLFNDNDAPDNREWHEFGHHVMTDSLISGDNLLLPTTPGSANHGHYRNPDSTDSWKEAFAYFYSMLVEEANGYTRPHRYKWAGAPAGLGGQNLETDAWINLGFEDAQFAGVLWDLHDSNANYPGSADDDNVTISAKNIWNSVLNYDYGRGNIKEVYGAFYGFSIIFPAILNMQYLNNTFITHGIWNDTLYNLTYNVGEPVGFTSWSIPGGGGARHNNRPGEPIPTGAVMNINVIDAITGFSIDNVTLVVTNNVGDEFNITMLVVPNSTYLYIPQTTPYNLILEDIVAQKDGYDDSQPLTVNSTFYWERVLAGEEYLLNHTFVLNPTEPIDPNAPVLNTPTDGYQYKVCDNLLFKWGSGAGGPPPGNKYYFNADYDGDSPLFPVVDLLWTGTQLPIDWKFIEKNAPDGIYTWWVCNGPGGFECSSKWTIVKDTTPELIKPDGDTVSPGYVFDWEAIANTKNYVVKLTGHISGYLFTPFNPLYLAMGPSDSHILTQAEYNLLTGPPGSSYTWALSAVCNQNPKVSDMKKYSYSDSFTFFK